MGWLFTQGQTRAELIRKRTEPWKSTNGDGSGLCLAHACVGNVLWSVWEVSHADGRTLRHIECDLMAPQRGYGWGCKEMEESMHPFYYSCPLPYLDMAPVACEAWRAQVREYHAKRAAARRRLGEIKVGDAVRLPDYGMTVTITRLRPLAGTFEGIEYRVPWKALG